RGQGCGEAAGARGGPRVAGQVSRADPAGHEGRTAALLRQEERGRDLMEEGARPAPSFSVGGTPAGGTHTASPVGGTPTASPVGGTRSASPAGGPPTASPQTPLPPAGPERLRRARARELVAATALGGAAL